MTTEITPHEARLVLAAAGEPGLRTYLSGFTGRLTSLMAVADSDNLDRLALGWPGLVAAYRLWVAEGDAPVREIALSDRG